MSYLVNEVFWTLQGEGTHVGRPAVFCRFSRCNLWTGREQDRAGAICKFCDTDFTDYERYDTAADLVSDIAGCLPPDAGDRRTPMVVLTGGEPLLQVDRALVRALLAVPLYVAVETNGTRPVPVGIDWVCVSPKAGAPLVLREADEVKLVWPQPELMPTQVAELISADSYRLQPMDGPDLAENTRSAIDYCLAHPQWDLSLQTHKILEIR